MTPAAATRSRPTCRSLYAERTKLAIPDDHVILPEVISQGAARACRAPGRRPVVQSRQVDALRDADGRELGVTSKNVDEKTEGAEPETKRLLGMEGNFGEGMGLTQDWAYRIIKNVGNYGEVFEKNLGDSSKLKIKRGINALWTNKGLQYAPPIR